MKTGFLQSEQLPDLWIDALVVDPDKQLLFMSAWGNESVIQKMRAQFSLSPEEGGLSHFQLSSGPDTGVKEWVSVEHREQYEQLTGRPSGQSVFLHLTQGWVFSRLAVTPDLANGRGVLLRRLGVSDGLTPMESKAVLRRRLWEMIKKICPIPLHDSWDALVLELWNLGYLKQCRGFAMEAWSLTLEEKTLQPLITRWMQQGKLMVPPIH